MFLQAFPAGKAEIMLCFCPACINLDDHQGLLLISSNLKAYILFWLTPCILVAWMKERNINHPLCVIDGSETLTCLVFNTIHVPQQKGDREEPDEFSKPRITATTTVLFGKSRITKLIYFLKWIMCIRPHCPSAIFKTKQCSRNST